MKRVVTNLPLTELWNDTGPIHATHQRDLTANDIRDLLQAGPAQFVVAEVGEPLRWIPTTDCFRLWKSEVQEHVANPAGAALESFSGGYCYFASEWSTKEGVSLVVLSVAH